MLATPSSRRITSKLIFSAVFISILPTKGMNAEPGLYADAKKRLNFFWVFFGKLKWRPFQFSSFRTHRSSISASPENTQSRKGFTWIRSGKASGSSDSLLNKVSAIRCLLDDHHVRLYAQPYQNWLLRSWASLYIRCSSSFSSIWDKCSTLWYDLSIRMVSLPTHRSTVDSFDDEERRAILFEQLWCCNASIGQLCWGEIREVADW